MDPYEFEKLVAKVWEVQGYDTFVRQGSNDKAIDVEAIRGGYKVLIQVKRYNSKNKIGGPTVRKYATLYQQEPDADEVAIVTTSSFTSQAKEIAAEQHVTIVDGHSLVSMMGEIGVTNKSSDKTESRPDGIIGTIRYYSPNGIIGKSLYYILAISLSIYILPIIFIWRYRKSIWNYRGTLYKIWVSFWILGAVLFMFESIVTISLHPQLLPTIGLVILFGGPYYLVKQYLSSNKAIIQESVEMLR